MHIYLQGIDCVCIKNTRPNGCNHRHQRVQLSSVLKIKMVQPSWRPYFGPYYYIVWKSNNACNSTRTILKWKSKILMYPRRIVQDIRVVQSDHILPRFLRRGHVDDCCSCNHRTVSPSAFVSHWKLRVTMIPTFSSLAVLEVVVMTTPCATSDKVGIETTIGFQCPNLTRSIESNSVHFREIFFSLSTTWSAFNICYITTNELAAIVWRYTDFRRSCPEPRGSLRLAMDNLCHVLSPQSYECVIFL